MCVCVCVCVREREGWEREIEARAKRAITHRYWLLSWHSELMAINAHKSMVDQVE